MLPSGPHGNMNKPSSKKAMDSELAESVRPIIPNFDELVMIMFYPIFRGTKTRGLFIPFDSG